MEMKATVRLLITSGPLEWLSSKKEIVTKIEITLKTDVLLIEMLVSLKKKFFW